MKTKIILVLIFLAGFSLRFWRVGDYPPLLWDEASLGYNAYSLIKTGKDEYGQNLPLIFKSFGDYKPGFYIYLTLPFVWIGGLSELTVRLPSVLLGSLTPIILYYLVKQLTDDKNLSLLTSGVLAFMPWHIHFSRGAWEANVMTFFVVLGSYGVAKWLDTRIVKWLIAGLVSFLFGLITYQGGKLIVPLILGGILFSHHKKIKPIFSNCTIAQSEKFIGICVFLMMALWYVLSFSGSAGNRLKVMSLFSYRRPQSEIEQTLTEDNFKTKNLHFYLFHGEWLHFLKGSLSRYFNHFSPRFLGFEGDWQNSRHSAPYIGNIAHLGLILFILGLFYFVKSSNYQNKWFFLYWLVVSPIPAALTRDSVSSVRSLTMVIPLAFFIAYGINFIRNIKIPKKLLITVYLLLFTIFAFDFTYYLDLYYNHMVKLSPKQWLYGYDEAARLVIDNQQSFDQIVMTDFYGQPYIFYLFYSQYPPERFQNQVVFKDNNLADVGTVTQIDNIKFRPINWKIDSEKENSLIIISEDEVFRNKLDKKPVLNELNPIGQISGRVMYYSYEK